MSFQCSNESLVAAEDPFVIKHLTKHGNSLALVIDKPILDLLGIDADTPLEVKTDGNALRVRPVRPGEGDKKFSAALARVKQRYGGALKRLAD